MSSESDPLTALEAVNSGAETLKKIVSDAEKSLLIIAPWHGAVTDHPQMNEIIQNIVGHCTKYIQAIDTSIKTAEDGYSISSDAVDLCDFLLDSEVEATELQSYIRDMQSKAKEALHECTNTMNRFNEVHTGLIEMTKALPKEAWAAREGDKSFFVRFIGGAVSTIATAMGRKQPMGFEAAMKELRLAALDVAQLSTSIKEFVSWWANMDTQLKAADSSSSSLVSNKDNPLRIKSVRKKWKKIRSEYGIYKVEIVNLRGYYIPEITLGEDAN